MDSKQTSALAWAKSDPTLESLENRGHVRILADTIEDQAREISGLKADLSSMKQAHAFCVCGTAVPKMKELQEKLEAAQSECMDRLIRYEHEKERADRLAAELAEARDRHIQERRDDLDTISDLRARNDRMREACETSAAELRRIWGKDIDGEHDGMHTTFERLEKAARESAPHSFLDAALAREKAFMLRKMAEFCHKECRALAGQEPGDIVGNPYKTARYDANAALAKFCEGFAESAQEIERRVP